jgi:hypothetical protein
MSTRIDRLAFADTSKVMWRSLLPLLLVSACSTMPPTEFCSEAHLGIDIVISKGRSCLAETSFRLEAFDTESCVSRVEEDCTGDDRARISQWLHCWDGLPSCSGNNVSSFLESGNNCAKDAGLAVVAHRCRVVLGDTSSR